MFKKFSTLDLAQEYLEVQHASLLMIDDKKFSTLDLAQEYLEVQLSSLPDSNQSKTRRRDLVYWNEKKIFADEVPSNFTPETIVIYVDGACKGNSDVHNNICPGKSLPFRFKGGSLINDICVIAGWGFAAVSGGDGLKDDRWRLICN